MPDRGRTRSAAYALPSRQARLDEKLRALRPGAFFTSFRRQSPAFWFLCAYFFIEYVRPQQVWRSIDVLPWGMTMLGLSLGAYFLGGEGGKRRLTMLDVGLLVYTAILLLSSITGTDRAASMQGWELFANWIIVYLLVSDVVRTPQRFFIFLALFLLWSLKMSQHGARTFAMRGFTFADWGATGGPGWFHNSGEFAIQMCIFLPLSYYFFSGLRRDLSRWVSGPGLVLLGGTAVLSLIASSSRGGQLAGGLVILFIIAQSKQRVKAFAVAIGVVATLWVIMPEEQKARFASMGEDRTSQNRLAYWSDGIQIMKDHPALGIGYNAWDSYYRRHFNPQGELPHNIFIQAGAELGYTGLAALLLLVTATFVVNRRTRTLASRVLGWGDFLRASAFGLDAALIGFLISGSFVTVLYYPYLWVQLAFTAALHETARRAARADRSRRSQSGITVKTRRPRDHLNSATRAVQSHPPAGPS